MRYIVNIRETRYSWYSQPFWLPTISETGNSPPESCIFTLGLSICSFILGFCTIVHYMKIADLFASLTPAPVYYIRLNIVCLVLGLLTSIGMLFVAAFQAQNVLVVHNIAAFLLFTSQLVYMWAITRIVYLYRRGLRVSDLVVRVKIVICLVNSAFYVGDIRFRFCVSLLFCSVVSALVSLNSDFLLYVSSR